MANKKTRQALGRGLSSLIPVLDGGDISDTDVLDVDIESIMPNPFQPRKDFNSEDIGSLAESIKSQGLLQPVVLRKRAGRYEIISGERRLRAMKHIGEKRIPAIIKEKITESKMLEMALVENIQREDLNDIELAKSFQRLLFDCGLSHKDLSEHIGKSRSAITNTLRLLKLPEQIKDLVREGKISPGHARALLSIKDRRAQLALAKKIVSQELSVREIENITQAKVKGEKAKAKGGVASYRTKAGKPTDPDIKHQEDQLRYLFGTDVKIKTGSGYKGKLEIHYYSKEDLNRILNIMRS